MSARTRGYRKRTLGIIVRWMIVGIVLGIVLMALFSGKLFSKSKTVISAELIENRLEEIAELATVNYHYKNMGQYENTSTFYGLTLPFATKKFILSYTGEIKAGVDLKEIKAEVSGKKITITLPEAKILSHAIDEKSVTVFNEQTSIFNPIKIEDMTSFTADQKEKIEKEVMEKGLLVEASRSAQKIISTILSLDKELFEGYEIVFK